MFIIRHPGLKKYYINMIVMDNGHRFLKYHEYSKELNTPYDYSKNGLLNKMMSEKISQSKSPVLKMMYDFYERSLIFLLQQVDVLAHYKDIAWKNR